MPKRLRTILEDSVGIRSSLHQQLPARGDVLGNSSNHDGLVADDESSGNAGYKNTTLQFKEADGDDEYLIANIGIYLVSAKLSIMVCHYENPSLEERSSTQRHATAICLPAQSTASPLSSSKPGPDCCDCASSALDVTDTKRIQHLLSQIHKLDTIDSVYGYGSEGAGAAGYRSGAQRFAPEAGLTSSSSVGVGSGGRPTFNAASSNSSSIASRHVQVYSVDSKRLICAFPEEGYRNMYGRLPLDAARDGASLHSLLVHCLDKKSESHAENLLQSPNIPNSDPIRLELKVRSNAYEPPADVQSIFFRWGNLLFVSQQARSDNAAYSSNTNVAVKSEESNILSNYNICTPPNDRPARSNMLSDSSARAAHSGLHQHSNRGSSGTRDLPGQQSNNQSRHLHHSHYHYTQHGASHSSEARVFSLPRAPASVAASLPPRPPATLTPPESAPLRRQSSYTLPPVKSFEERRFSYPIQILNGERRPPALPIMPHQQQTPMGVASINSAPVGGTTRGSPLAATAASPSSNRISDLRMRSVVGYGVRPSVSIVTKNVGEALSQPTPAISPMSAAIVQHTPVSLSPAPQSKPHSANPGSVQVNV
ncbi:hypothetical protein GGH99_006933, partial [Coemansia sp. RSA 1285]